MNQTQGDKADEWITFLLLAVFLAPATAIAIVGGYGLVVWVSQLLLGPPGMGM